MQQTDDFSDGIGPGAIGRCDWETEQAQTDLELLWWIGRFRFVTAEQIAERLGLVDHWAGFRALEVWADLADPTQYAMVSWWDSPAEFQAYMQSDDHRRSHERIPTGSHRPRPVRFRRFRVVAT